MTSTADLLRKVATDLFSEFQQQSTLYSETQARRAISTAYYAVFHLFCDEGVSLLFDSLCDPKVKAIAIRSFSHMTMKNVCKKLEVIQNSTYKDSSYNALISPFNSLIADIAKKFIPLQEARHEADYNLSNISTSKMNYDFSHNSFSLKNSIADMETIFNSWDSLKQNNIAQLQVFVSLLLFDNSTYLYKK